MGNQPSQLAATNPGTAARLEKQLMGYGAAQNCAHRAHALADPGRIILLKLVADAGRSCVGDLCLISGIEQGSTSRNLRILWRAGLLERQVRHGYAMYSLSASGERLLAALVVEED